MKRHLNNKNNLIKAQHPEYGVWYFTSLNIFADAIGTQRNAVDYYIKQNKQYKNWTLEIADASEIPYKYINPERI